MPVIMIRIYGYNGNTIIIKTLLLIFKFIHPEPITTRTGNVNTEDTIASLYERYLNNIFWYKNLIRFLILMIIYHSVMELIYLMKTPVSYPIEILIILEI